MKGENGEEELDVQYVDDDVIAALDDELYGEEDDAGDFETINEEEFAEGD
jgi:WD40 repeat protein